MLRDDWQRTSSIKHSALLRETALNLQPRIPSVEYEILGSRHYRYISPKQQGQKSFWKQNHNRVAEAPSEREANNCSLHCREQTSFLQAQTVINYMARVVMVVVNKPTAGSHPVRGISKSLYQLQAVGGSKSFYLMCYLHLYLFSKIFVTPVTRYIL